MLQKIKTFTDLVAWQQAHKLVLAIYKITNTFPKSELYCLIDQMRRCVVSITSNIAEGFSRKTQKEKQQFYFTALGSLTELENQLTISRDLLYITEEEFLILTKEIVRISKLIRGLIKTAATYT